MAKHGKYLIFALPSRQRPYHVENTSSRLITEVKQRWAGLVLGWVTAWEHLVLLSSFGTGIWKVKRRKVLF